MLTAHIITWLEETWCKSHAFLAELDSYQDTVKKLGLLLCNIQTCIEDRADNAFKMFYKHMYTLS